MEQLETDKQRIKKIFCNLDKDFKDEAKSKIAQKFKITVDVAKIHWIYGGSIPSTNVKGVLKIVIGVANKQVEKMKSLLN